MVRACVGLLAAVVMVATVACNAPPDDGFGKPKPVTDTGMVGKPPAPVEVAPDWASAFELVPSFDAATSTVTVNLKIKPGFHAYGPGEEVSKPVGMTVKATNGWAVDGTVQIPAGVKKDLGELGTSVILEGDVPLKAKVKGGTGAVEGTVEVQVCTDKACDRPRQYPFSTPAA
jgi:hypothetical protein